MKAVSRPYMQGADLAAATRFLRDSYRETGSLHNWLPGRFENAEGLMKEGGRVWTREGSQEVVGMVTTEGDLRFFLHVRSDHAALIHEALDWVIKYSSEHRAADQHTVSVVNLEGGLEREAALTRHGFARGKVYGILRTRDVRAQIPIYDIPEGYAVRSISPSDFKELARCVRVVFGHGEWFDENVIAGISRASFYREDLDLVAVDHEGRIASFCTFRFDASTGVTELEPMGTLPEHRNRGLGKALLCEGFRRLSKYNPTLLYIDGAANTPAANRLYNATGFTDRQDYNYWSREIP